LLRPCLGLLFVSSDTPTGEPRLSDMSRSRWYQEASPFRRGVTERFCARTCKFTNPPTLLRLSEAWEKSAGSMARVAASRPFQVPDGANWRSCGTPSFVLPPSSRVAGKVPGPCGLLESARALLQFGNRVFRGLGGPGEVGTG
jgi:hypothetical protein